MQPRSGAGVKGGVEVVNADAVRGQVLLEESREAVVVLDAAEAHVVVASRRARQSLGVGRARSSAPSCSRASAR